MEIKEFVVDGISCVVGENLAVTYQEDVDYNIEHNLEAEETKQYVYTAHPIIQFYGLGCIVMPIEFGGGKCCGSSEVKALSHDIIRKNHTCSDHSWLCDCGGAVNISYMSPEEKHEVNHAQVVHFNTMIWDQTTNVHRKYAFLFITDVMRILGNGEFGATDSSKATYVECGLKDNNKVLTDIKEIEHGLIHIHK